MTRKQHSYILISLLFFSILSCQSDHIFKETHSFEKYTWTEDEEILFAADISEEQAGNFYTPVIHIRYIKGFYFKYMNIGLIIRRPDGSESSKVLSIQMLTDDKKYRGDGMGDIWDLDYAVSENIEIKEAGKYEIEIKSLMGEQPVNFIHKIGVSLKDIPKE
jgi:gliding motility-associated lipoprotein GldH